MTSPLGPYLPAGETTLNVQPELGSAARLQEALHASTDGVRPRMMQPMAHLAGGEVILVPPLSCMENHQ
jgi:hypothetical protein